MASSKGKGLRKRGELAKARKPIDKSVLKGLANTVRNQILAILNERRGSATSVAKDLGLDFAEVNYEIEVLRKAKLIKKVGQRQRGNTTEVFYVATSRAYIDPSEWPEVADPIQAGLRASLLQNIWIDAVTAVSEETYDSLDDSFESSHMSWTPMIVDRQGWNDLMEILLRLMGEVIDIQQESAERLVAEDAEGISCSVAALGFPSANPKRKISLPADAEQLADLTQEMRSNVKISPKRKAKATGKGSAGKAASKSKGEIAGKADPKRKRKGGSR